MRVETANRQDKPATPAPWFAGAGAIRLVLLAGSEFDQLGARHDEPHPTGSEIHGQGGLRLDAEDTAEAVGVVANLISHGELLCRRRGRWGSEGAGGQEAPGRSAGWLHPYQYAPAGRFAACAIRHRLHRGAPRHAERISLHRQRCWRCADGPAWIPACLSRRWNNLTDEDVLVSVATTFAFVKAPAFSSWASCLLAVDSPCRWRATGG